MKLIYLISYRRELIADHERKLFAIDVLLGKSSPNVEPPRLQNGKRSKGRIVNLIREALSSAPAQFTVDDVFSAIQAQHASDNVRRWDVVHALWRMGKAGELAVPESHKGKRPKTYEKKP